MLFEEFGKLAQNRLRPVLGSVVTGCTYAKAKQASAPYQTAKQQFINKAKHLELGIWQNKPPELDEFGLPWCD